MLGHSDVEQGPERSTIIQKQDHYQQGTYIETQLRRDFLDPFFMAMGWDIDKTIVRTSTIGRHGPPDRPGGCTNSTA